MQYRYKFSNGDVSNVEISSELWVEIKEMDAETQRINRRASGGRRKAGRNLLFSELTYYCDGTDVDYINDVLLNDNSDILAEIIEKEMAYSQHAALSRGISSLQPQQRTLLTKIYIQRKKAVDVAREEGVSEAAISQRLKLIYGKLRTHIETAI